MKLKSEAFKASVRQYLSGLFQLPTKLKEKFSKKAAAAPPAASTRATGPEGTVIVNPATVPGVAPRSTAAVPAGFMLRFLSRWIDTNLLVILAIFTAVFAGIPWVVGAPLLLLIYFGILHGLSGQTLGKKILRLKLVEPEGSKVSYSKSFLRTLTDFLNVLTFGIGYLLVIFTPNKQALHDKLVKTKVVTAGPCPIWIVAIAFAAPALAWVAVIWTVGMTVITSIAGPFYTITKLRSPAQPVVNINIETQQTQSSATSNKADAKAKEEKQEEIKPAPTPAAPKPAPAAITETAEPLEADRQTQEAAAQSIEKYLRAMHAEKIGSIRTEIPKILMHKRRGIIEATYEVAGQQRRERFLVIQFADGWKVVRPLSSKESLDWQTGKIIQTR